LSQFHAVFFWSFVADRTLGPGYLRRVVIENPSLK